jgi:hypothetical protein
MTLHQSMSLSVHYQCTSKTRTTARYSLTSSRQMYVSDYLTSYTRLRNLSYKCTRWNAAARASERRVTWYTRHPSSITLATIHLEYLWDCRPKHRGDIVARYNPPLLVRHSGEHIAKSNGGTIIPANKCKTLSRMHRIWPAQPVRWWATASPHRLFGLYTLRPDNGTWLGSQLYEPPRIDPRSLWARNLRHTTSKDSRCNDRGPYHWTTEPKGMLRCPFVSEPLYL